MTSHNIPKMSLVAQYDDLCRYTKVLTTGCEEEFKIFVEGQQMFLRKWRDSELELQQLKETIAKLEKEKVRCEAQVKHLRSVVESEIAKRERTEREKGSMERQLALIKDVLLADGTALDNQTKERLFLLSRQGVSPSKLTTIEESADLLSASDFDESADDMLNDGSRRRSRHSNGKRRSSGGLNFQKRKKSDVMDALQEELQLPEFTLEDIVVNKNVASRRSSSEPNPQQREAPKLRPALRSDSEHIRRTRDNTGTLGSTPMGRYSTGGKLSRTHAFVTKTVIRTEKCYPCGKLIKFCKQGLKCQDCRVTCHPECQEQCPLPCIPVTITPARGTLGSIADYTSSTAPMIPSLIVHCINEIESRGFSEVGLYRIPGSEREVKDLKEKLLKNKIVSSMTQMDIHAICGTVKEFLRSLKEPLLTRASWKTFVEAADNKNEDISYNLLYSAVCDLPQPNKETLAFLILHLQRVADAPECKMPIDNLAKVFGPTIVGYSTSDPVDSASMFLETAQQGKVMHRLLMIPTDSWQNLLNVEPQIFNTHIKTPECLPAPVTSRLGPIYTSGHKSRSGPLGRTPLTPRRRDTTKNSRRQFFTSPMLK